MLVNTRLILFILLLFVTDFARSQDIGISGIANPIPGQDIVAGADCTLVFNVTNFGTVDYGPGDSLNIHQTLNGGFPTFILFIIPTGVTFNGGETIQLSPVSPFSFPDTLGPSTICLSTTLFNDINHQNDTFCQTYDIISSVDEWALRQEEAKVFYRDGSVTVLWNNLNFQGDATLTVTNVAGQQLNQRRVSFSGQSNLKENLILGRPANGIYILSISTEKGLLLSRKFSIFEE